MCSVAALARQYKIDVFKKLKIKILYIKKDICEIHTIIIIFAFKKFKTDLKTVDILNKLHFVVTRSTFSKQGFMIDCVIQIHVHSFIH